MAHAFVSEAQFLTAGQFAIVEDQRVFKRSAFDQAHLLQLGHIPHQRKSARGGNLFPENPGPHLEGGLLHADDRIVVFDGERDAEKIGRFGGDFNVAVTQAHRAVDLVVQRRDSLGLDHSLFDQFDIAQGAATRRYRRFSAFEPDVTVGHAHARKCRQHMFHRVDRHAVLGQSGGPDQVMLTGYVFDQRRNLDLTLGAWHDKDQPGIDRGRLEGHARLGTRVQPDAFDGHFVLDGFLEPEHLSDLLIVVFFIEARSGLSVLNGRQSAFQLGYCLFQLTNRRLQLRQPPGSGGGSEGFLGVLRRRAKNPAAGRQVIRHA